MTEIKSKFSKGDKVWIAQVEYGEEKIGCPDCLGTKKWLITFADGSAENIECQTCRRGYEPANGYIIIKKTKPKVIQLVVGSVRFNDNDEKPFSYMCVETGVGSGYVYYENDMFSDESSALSRANEKYEEQMQAIAQNNFSKKFGGTKELEEALATWGFSRKSQVEKAQKFRQWADISGILK